MQWQKDEDNKLENTRKRHDDKRSFKYRNFGIKSSGCFVYTYYLRSLNRYKNVQERKMRKN